MLPRSANDGPPGFRLVIYVDTDAGLPADLLIRTLKIVQRALHHADLWEINQLRIEMPEVPDIALDAATERLRRNRDVGIQIDSLKSGSLIISAGIFAFSWWVLDKTIGHSVEEAYEKTDLNRRLVEWLRSNLKRKAEKVYHDTNRALTAEGLGATGLESYALRDDVVELKITIIIRRDSEWPPPTYGELFGWQQPNTPKQE